MTKLPKGKRLSPQEKKALSLKKDRRENYGQNDKASRKLVPLRKSQAQRRLRRADKQSIDAVLVDIEAAEALSDTRSKPDFIKQKGVTLEDDIALSALASLKREGRKTRTRAEELEWFEKFHGPAIAARMRDLYRNFGWIEDQE